MEVRIKRAKTSLSKLSLSSSLEVFLEAQMADLAFDYLPIELRHALAVGSLPLHHRDPFDRLIVSQCLTDDLPVISADAILDMYGVRRIWT